MTSLTTTSSSAAAAMNADFPTPYPIQIQAGKKILKWYRDCSEVRAIENQARSQLIEQNAGKNNNTFSAERIVTKKGRQKLAVEVDEILKFYASDEGRQFLQQNPLAEGNRDRWRDIASYLVFDRSYMPIVIRDKDHKIAAVELVTAKHQFRLEHLAAAPQNLGKKTGAGTAAFEDAVWLCARKGYDALYLTATNSSRPFYTKLDVPLNYNHGCLPATEFAAFLQNHGGKVRKVDPDETDEKTPL